MTYRGTIIEESLSDKRALKTVRIIRTRVENVNDRHKTPWLKFWTLHTIEIPEEKADEVANFLSGKIDTSHSSWYIDYKSERIHYIIFPGKVFKVDKQRPSEYRFVKEYGISLGIPDYQLDFSPQIR